MHVKAAGPAEAPIEGSVASREATGGTWRSDPVSATEPPVGPDAPILAVMATTRAMRRLSPDRVPDELLWRVVEAATWAPSPGNTQLTRYLIVTDRATIARLAVPWRRAVADFRMAADAIGLDKASFARDGSAIDYQRDHFADIPALVVVCQDPTVAGPLRSRAAIVASLIRRAGPRRGFHILLGLRRLDRSGAGGIYPAVENLLLAARALGLGACLTTWHLIEEDTFKRVLGVPRHVTIGAVVPIGWPLGRFGPVVRRPVDEVIRRDRW